MSVLELAFAIGLGIFLERVATFLLQLTYMYYSYRKHAPERERRQKEQEAFMRLMEDDMAQRQMERLAETGERLN